MRPLCVCAAGSGVTVGRRVDFYCEIDQIVLTGLTDIQNLWKCLCYIAKCNSNHRWLLCSISLKGHSITRGRRCVSIVIRAHIDVFRQCDHSQFNARIDRHLAGGAARPVIPAARTERHCGLVTASVCWPTNQPPPPPPPSSPTSSPSHPPRPPASCVK